MFVEVAFGKVNYLILDFIVRADMKFWLREDIVFRYLTLPVFKACNSSTKMDIVLFSEANLLDFVVKKLEVVSILTAIGEGKEVILLFELKVVLSSLEVD